MGKRFTYSGDPSKNKRDRIRFLIGDTVEARPLFDDREIDFQITQTPNDRMAGAELLDVKSREFARLADIKVGDVSKSFSKVSEQMKKCAALLRDQALRRAKPFFGGLTKSGKRALASDTDAVQPQFLLGMEDNPGAVQLNADVSALFSALGSGGI